MASRALAGSAHETPYPEAPTASERILAAELEGRGESCEALSMMVASLARMVQAGKSSQNRCKAG